MSTNLSPLRIALALGLLAVVPVAAQPQHKPEVRFEFAAKRTSDGKPPRSRVFLNVGGKRAPVFSFDEEFQTMSRDGFAAQGIPRDALAACFGWWAGAGDNLYVVRRGARLDVYRQEVDEVLEHPLPYRLITSVALPRRVAKRARKR